MIDGGTLIDIHEEKSVSKEEADEKKKKEKYLEEEQTVGWSEIISLLLSFLPVLIGPYWPISACPLQ